MTRRRHQALSVQVTHSCSPDEEAVARAVRMWAGFIATNRQRAASPQGHPRPQPGADES